MVDASNDLDVFFPLHFLSLYFLLDYFHLTLILYTCVQEVKCLGPSPCLDLSLRLGLHNGHGMTPMHNDVPTRLLSYTFSNFLFLEAVYFLTQLLFKR